MGSRLRDNPERIFELFVEIGKPSNNDEAPFLLQHYPLDYSDEGILKDVPKFAFPCVTECGAVDYFTFVLTDSKSKFTYGFCRYATGAHTCLCILSALPWFEIFYRFLNLLAEISNRTENNDITHLLGEAYVVAVPEPCNQVTLVAQEEMFTFAAPDTNKLPSIPASRNLTEYYNAMDTANMINIFACLLHERRVLFTSKKLSRVTACVHAAATLIYPMNWQHLFIPILPNSYTDLLSAPMPYIIGVHSSIMEKAKKLDLSGVVIVDTDNNTLNQEYDDASALPDEMLSILKKMLRSDKLRSSMQLEGDAISRAFLMSLVRTIGGYRDALRFQPNEKISFQRDAFLLTRPSSMRPFLEDLLELQIFHEFINERLDMLNCGIGFTDVFEREATQHADKLNANSRYKEWLGNMKKQGKKLQRGGKDIWDDFKVKVKSQGKKTYTGIKTKIEDFYKDDLDPGGDRFPNMRIRHESGESKPSTILGSELKSARPPRPPPRSKSNVVRSPKVYTRSPDRSRSKHYRLISIEDKAIDDIDLLRTQKLSVNLMDDPDIQNAIRKSVSMEEITHQAEESEASSLESGSHTPSEGAHFSYVDLTTIDESAENASSSVDHVPWVTSNNVGSHTFTLGESSTSVVCQNNWQSFNSPEKEKTAKPSIAPSVPPRPSTSTIAAVIAALQNESPPIPPPRGKHPQQKTKNTSLIMFGPEEEFDPLGGEKLQESSSLAAGPETETTHAPSKQAFPPPISQPPAPLYRKRQTTIGSSVISRSPAFRVSKRGTGLQSSGYPGSSSFSTCNPQNQSTNEKEVTNYSSNNPTLLFDPLLSDSTGLKEQKKSQKPNTTPKMDNYECDELLQSWNFHKKTSYLNTSTNAFPTLPSSSSSAVIANAQQFQNSSPLPSPLIPSNSPVSLKHVGIGGAGRLSRHASLNVDVGQKPPTDLFADLVHLHKTKSRTPSPQPRNQKTFQ